LDDADDQSAIEGVNLVLRVEGSTVTPYAGTLTQTVINGARTDVSPNCGQSVIITSFKERPQIANDTVLQIKQRNVPYDSSTLDISRITTVIADSEGSPLLVVGLGAAPPYVDTSLLPDVGLSADQTPVCRWAPSFGSLVRVHVTASGADCALDSGTQRCCSMFGHTMEAEVPAATLVSNRDPKSWSTSRYAAPGFSSPTRDARRPGPPLDRNLPLSRPDAGQQSRFRS
jgi:hypothetical protein